MGERWRSGSLTMRPKGATRQAQSTLFNAKIKGHASLPQISHHFTVTEAPIQQLTCTAPKQDCFQRGWAHWEEEIFVLGQQPITNHESGLCNSFLDDPWKSLSLVFWRGEDGCSWTLWTTSPVSSQSCAGAEIHPVNHIMISAGATNKHSANCDIIRLFQYNHLKNCILLFYVSFLYHKTHKLAYILLLYYVVTTSNCELIELWWWKFSLLLRYPDAEAVMQTPLVVHVLRNSPHYAQ